MSFDDIMVILMEFIYTGFWWSIAVHWEVIVNEGDQKIAYAKLSGTVYLTLTDSESSQSRIIVIISLLIDKLSYSCNNIIIIIVNGSESNDDELFDDDDDEDRCPCAPTQSHFYDDVP